MTPFEQQQARERSQAIADLQGHWDGHYEIGWDAGMSVAIRRYDGATVRQPTARQLHDQMVQDHAARPTAKATP